MNYTFTVYEQASGKWMPVVRGNAPSADVAQREMLHYFVQYAKDGAVIKAEIRFGQKTVGRVATPGAPA